MTPFIAYLTIIIYLILLNTKIACEGKITIKGSLFPSSKELNKVRYLLMSKFVSRRLFSFPGGPIFPYTYICAFSLYTNDFKNVYRYDKGWIIVWETLISIIDDIDWIDNDEDKLGDVKISFSSSDDIKIAKLFTSGNNWSLKETSKLEELSKSIRTNSISEAQLKEKLREYFPKETLSHYDIVINEQEVVTIINDYRFKSSDDGHKTILEGDLVFLVKFKYSGQVQDKFETDFKNALEHLRKTLDPTAYKETEDNIKKRDEIGRYPGFCLEIIRKVEIERLQLAPGAFEYIISFKEEPFLENKKFEENNIAIKINSFVNILKNIKELDNFLISETEFGNVLSSGNVQSEKYLSVFEEHFREVSHNPKSETAEGLWKKRLVPLLIAISVIGVIFFLGVWFYSKGKIYGTIGSSKSRRIRKGKMNRHFSKGPA